MGEYMQNTMQKKPLVILTGPTAVGKSALSVLLAKSIGGEVISADSMQVYRHMDIGSAKITQAEMEGGGISCGQVSVSGERSASDDLCQR